MVTHAEPTPIVWTSPVPPRRRVRGSVMTASAVLLLVLAHAAFLIDLHNLGTTPDSCEVYCATVPAVEVPALLGYPLLDLLCGVAACVLLAVRGPRQVLAWVLLATVPMQVVMLIEVSLTLRVLS
ncbi:hypothetical protein [Curtobacterium sp. ISL-83]|uniref:hypothetical protein n=1 Tax=Curtobacterium sp. ISL-83 TaxID=2819145 RepID=UPI001BE7D2DA|nr:hypothetical protein [Curtobacterium sp. ISL-83]MBT2504224.1 hypothetical protein [Curtobacterium sp. ISL-83]